VKDSSFKRFESLVVDYFTRLTTNVSMKSVVMEKVQEMESSQRDLQSVFSGAVFKAMFVIGGLALVFESARNSLTWHLARFWGSAGDNWQELWENTLDVVGHNNPNLCQLRFDLTCRLFD
jgi:hypothetical protein